MLLTVPHLFVSDFIISMNVCHFENLGPYQKRMFLILLVLGGSDIRFHSELSLLRSLFHQIDPWRASVFLYTTMYHAFFNMSSPTNSVSIHCSGRLAQLVERTLSMREVEGSKPSLSILFHTCTIYSFPSNQERHHQIETNHT